MTMHTIYNCDVCGKEFRYNAYSMDSLPSMKKIEENCIEVGFNQVKHLCKECYVLAWDKLNVYYEFLQNAYVNRDYYKKSLQVKEN